MRTESDVEIRRSERKAVRVAVILLSECDGKKVESEARALDLSQHGVRLQADIPLTQGQVVDVTTNEGPDYAVRGRVIWTGAIGSEREGEVGFEFLSPLRLPA